MSQKTTVALFMGGDSGEYEVSIGSAGVVSRFLDKEKFEVFPILLRKQHWVCHLDDNLKVPVDKNDFSIMLNGEKIFFDVAFIAIHGTPGEDGKLQGYLEMMEVPYTSCDLTTSSVTFNKYFCNSLALQYGMLVALTIFIRETDSWDAELLINQVGLPCFVKPNKAGSSVGITKVYQLSELSAAIRKAFDEDDEVLVQQFISGREMACGVFRSDGKIIVLPVTEIIPKNDFFDYEAKYTEGKAEEVTPAGITHEEEEECRNITAYLYDKFNCKGVVRFDYFLVDGKWWFLEVNTVPGFSEGSIVPKQAKAAGYDLKDFFALILNECITTSRKSKNSANHNLK